MKTVIDQENTGKIHEEVSFGVFQFKCHTGVFLSLLKGLFDEKVFQSVKNFEALSLM